MPELPEVEILVRHLAPLMRGRTIQDITVHRAKSVRPQSVRAFRNGILGSVIQGVRRRAKYLLFDLQHPTRGATLLLGHLGMTGRMYVQSARATLPKHAAVSLRLNRGVFVFEDTRYFGRMTLDSAPLQNLGPEPLTNAFDGEFLFAGLRRCGQPIKPKLLDQSFLAGVGNIYASEALHRAGIHPFRQAGAIASHRLDRLVESIRRVLQAAIAAGGTTLKDFQDVEGNPGYFSRSLAVYGRAGAACLRCDGTIRQRTLSNRATYWCPRCQR